MCEGGDDCCNRTNKCGVGEGDCDSDDDCKGNLVCGADNCRGSTFDPNDDCCSPEATTRSTYAPP